MNESERKYRLEKLEELDRQRDTALDEYQKLFGCKYKETDNNCEITNRNYHGIRSHHPDFLESIGIVVFIIAFGIVLVSCF